MPVLDKKPCYRRTVLKEERLYKEQKFKDFFRKMKNRKKITYKKPAATQTFCKQNFPQMHHIDFIYSPFIV